MSSTVVHILGETPAQITVVIWIKLVELKGLAHSGGTSLAESRLNPPNVCLLCVCLVVRGAAAPHLDVLDRMSLCYTLTFHPKSGLKRI